MLVQTGYIWVKTFQVTTKIVGNWVFIPKMLCFRFWLIPGFHKLLPKGN